MGRAASYHRVMLIDRQARYGVWVLTIKPGLFVAEGLPEHSVMLTITPELFFADEFAVNTEASNPASRVGS